MVFRLKLAPAARFFSQSGSLLDKRVGRQVAQRRYGIVIAECFVG